MAIRRTYLPVREYALRRGLCPQTIWRQIREGRIETLRNERGELIVELQTHTSQLYDALAQPQRQASKRDKS